MNKYEKRIREFIRTEMGVELGEVNEPLKIGEWVDLFKKIELDVSKFGAGKLMFESCTFSIAGNVRGHGCEFNMHYGYVHHSGSNGHTGCFVTDGKKVLSYQKFYENGCKF